MKKIGVDIDGVLRNLYIKLVEVYRRELGPEEQCKDVEAWKSYILKDNFTIGKNTNDFFFNSKWTTEIYREAPAYDGISALVGLCEHYEVHLITHQPNQETEYNTLCWIHEHTNAKYHGFHFVKDKYIVECDMYAEDNPSQIQELIKMGKRVAIIDHRYNRGIDGMRFGDFQKFANHMLSLKRAGAL